MICLKATLDPLVFFQREYDGVTPALPFTATRPEEAYAWQRKARIRLRRLLGDFPKVTGPVKTRVLEERSFPGYTRTKLELELRPGLLAIGYYLLPGDRAKRGPAVLAVPGHGKSVDDLVGGLDGEGHVYDYALQCAMAGVPTLALEQMAFGYRRDPAAIEQAPDGGTSCLIPAGAALMLGRTLIGYRILDARRALDWLSARPEVDPARLGMTGISGGGQITFYTGAMETRLKAVLVCGYFNTYLDSVYSIHHCPDNHIPGVLKWFEMPDIAGLIAPRYAFFMQGEDDPIFPLKGFRAGVAKAEKIYEAFGVAERLGSHVYPGGHEWNGTKGVPFFVKALRG